MPLTKSPTRVIVHPIVLLSVVDHYNRLSKIGNPGRVVGILLGSWRKGDIVDVATSFAVPFDEDQRNLDVWFLDHSYLENMAAMFRKVNSRERVVGWYHTGPKLHQNDMKVHDLIRQFCPNAVLVIIDAKPKDQKLPTDAYCAIEEIHEDGTPTVKTFDHVSSEIGAEEAEEVGVEHLLRDIQDKTVGTLSQRISTQSHALEGLQRHMEQIQEYLIKVLAGKLPLNNPILYQLQDIFNLLPNLNLDEFAKSFAVKTNDQMLVIYVTSIVRSVLALHNLISNKVSNREAEKMEEEGGGSNKKDTGKKSGEEEGKKGDETKKTDDKKSDEKGKTETGAGDKKTK